MEKLDMVDVFAPTIVVEQDCQLMIPALLSSHTIVTVVSNASAAELALLGSLIWVDFTIKRRDLRQVFVTLLVSMGNAL